MPKSRFGYDASRGTTLRIAVGIAGIVPLFMGGGCKGEFTGPYPCETGYESCINPQANYCETDVTSSAAHCGSCDKSCDVGALCVDSQCHAAAQKLTTLQGGVVPVIAVNSTGVYWASPDESRILSVPLNGGTASTIVSNVNICGNTALTFALADGALTYLSNNGVACSAGPICTGLLSMPIPGTTPSLIASSSVIGNVGCPTSMVLGRNRVYWLQKQNNNSSTIMSVSLSDGSVATLVSFQANTTGSLALTDKSVLFATSDNGPPQLQTVPIASASTNLSPTKIVTTVDGKSNGFLAFAANNEYAFLATGGCPCNGKDTQEVPPSGTIYRHPISGGEGVAIATFQGLVNSMALDAKFIYWATDATIWKAPLAGGAATRIADNLAAGSTPFVCSNSCYTPNTATVSIAVDDQYVYFADTSANVNAIFKAKK